MQQPRALVYGLEYRSETYMAKYARPTDSLDMYMQRYLLIVMHQYRKRCMQLARIVTQAMERHERIAIGVQRDLEREYDLLVHFASAHPWFMDANQKTTKLLVETKAHATYSRLLQVGPLLETSSDVATVRGRGALRFSPHTLWE